MNTPKFTCVKTSAALAGFHDAELISVEHDPHAKSLTLRFKRTSGSIETLFFSDVVAQRMIDFADQNVASRVLVSPMHSFSVDELHAWVRWMYSRDDAKAPEVERAIVDRLHHDVTEGRRQLFILEPSCGAELAVLCESVAILTQCKTHHPV